MGRHSPFVTTPLTWGVTDCNLAILMTYKPSSTSVWPGTIVAIGNATERKAVGLMKIEIPFLTSLCLIATALLTRATIQGVEQALFATAIEYGLGGRKLLSNIKRLGR